MLFSHEVFQMMQLFTGRVVDPLNVQPSDIDIMDIAHNLSHICRFGGNCREFYSVAQHSVLCSLELTVCPSLMARKCHLRHKLLHDAAEAYLGDIPRPIKYGEGFAGYRHAEKALQGRIFMRFGLDHEGHPCVNDADNALLVREGIELMNARYGCGPASAQKIEPWTPAEAKAKFMTRYRELFLEVGNA
jgi:uncharacterized protein